MEHGKTKAREGTTWNTTQRKSCKGNPNRARHTPPKVCKRNKKMFFVLVLNHCSSTERMRSSLWTGTRICLRSTSSVDSRLSTVIGVRRWYLTRQVLTRLSLSCSSSLTLPSQSICPWDRLCRILNELNIPNFQVSTCIQPLPCWYQWIETLHLILIPPCSFKLFNEWIPQVRIINLCVLRRRTSSSVESEFVLWTDTGRSLRILLILLIEQFSSA